MKMAQNSENPYTYKINGETREMVIFKNGVPVYRAGCPEAAKESLEEVRKTFFEHHVANLERQIRVY